MDVLDDVEKRAQVSLDGKIDFTLKDKVVDGKLYVEQGIIAGCAGGGFENICQAADLIRGKYIGADEFTLSVYPASTPIYMELAKNGVLSDLIETVRSSRLHSVDHASVLEIHRQIMHSRSVTQQETSRTVKVRRSRMVRLLLSH